MSADLHSTRLAWKVCGLKDCENATAVGRLCPDFMGFIFYSGSPRYVGEAPDREFFEAAGPGTRRVGVFVNADPPAVAQACRRYRLDYAQLHGGELPEQCAELRRQGIGVIKAFGIGEHPEFHRLGAYEDVVDYFLFDYKSAAYGGSGRSFDWSLLHNYPYEKPYFLSGGLTMAGIRKLNPGQLPGLFAVDVNSGFESAPGIKNIAMLEELANFLGSHVTTGKTAHNYEGRG
jgi:phosphoribosylanthranilate isomerase